MCPTCKFAKARRRSTGHQGSKLPTQPSSLSLNVLRAGQKVSVNHFIVKEKGRLFDSKGKTPDHIMYTGGCIFYDHGSQFISIKLQVHLNVQETIAAKLAFEREMWQYGVIISSYHTDNGVFSSKDFIQEIESNLQLVKFSGVGGHHQNGCAERSIGTIFGLSRSMMIHCAIRWPEAFNVNIWPMSVLYAKWLANHVPKSNGIASIELIVRSKTARHVLKNAHVFGCPVYVLDPKLQDLGHLPKFQARSKRGMFMGFSERHSSLVPLVLNLATLSITPQYHVLFDDWFQTVDSNLTTESFQNAWCDLFDNNRYHYQFD
jgi:transposase InsO family protein